VNSISIESLPGLTDQADRPSQLDSTWWRIAAAWILIAGALLRFYALELKPLHHDEGVNGFFLVNLIRSAAGYRYDPANYHGPSLYYFARASVAMFGLTTFAIRFVPALFGTLTVALVLSWRARLGAIGSLAAAALIALSPGAVYMSRYFIHEALLVCFTVAFLVAAVRYIERRRTSDLLLAAVSAALMFATKETALISAAVMATAGAGTWLLTRRHRAERDWGAIIGWATTPSTLVAVSLSMAVFTAVNVLLFTSFLTHPGGIADALRSFALWTRTGTGAHLHPWSSYLSWLIQEEAVLLSLGLIGAGVALYRRRSGFDVFAALWAIGILAAYSIIPYKTPWLTLNLIVPLAVAAGAGVDRMYVRGARGSRWALPVVAIAAAGVTSSQAVNLNFVHYDDPRYPYVYVHTNRDLLRLVSRVDEIAAKYARATGARLHVTVMSPHQFPLSWYLRFYNVAYYDHPVHSTDRVLIGSELQESDLEAMYGQTYRRTDAYDLRPGVRLVLYERVEPAGH
jgi:uncharacterized protein (TIGR03663 family)